MTGAKHLIATLPHIFKIFQGPVSHMTIPLPGRNAAEPGKQKRKRLNSLADCMLNAFFLRIDESVSKITQRIDDTLSLGLIGQMGTM